jgi:hypothetical protein
MKRFPLPMCIAVLAGALSATVFEPQAQPKSKKSDKQSDKDKSKDKDSDTDKDKAAAADDNAPKPLFQGNIGIKSSRQGKDSAALGFNGLDPEGHVEKATLNAPVTKVDRLNAMTLIAYAPTKDELSQFISQGNLKAGSGPTAQPEDKKKKK